MVYANMGQSTPASSQDWDEFQKTTLLPWTSRIELAVRNQLFDPKDYGNFIAQFDFDELLRPDTQTRFNIYHNAMNDGLYSPDEIRMKEHMPPQLNGVGKEYLHNGNLVPNGSHAANIVSNNTDSNSATEGGETN